MSVADNSKLLYICLKNKSQKLHKKPEMWFSCCYFFLQFLHQPQECGRAFEISIAVLQLFKTLHTPWERVNARVISRVRTCTFRAISKPPAWRDRNLKKEKKRKRGEFLDLIWQKSLQGCRLRHPRTSNEIRMEGFFFFGSIGFSSSFSLLICADLRVLFLHKLAPPDEARLARLTRMEKYLGQHRQGWYLKRRGGQMLRITLLGFFFSCSDSLTCLKKWKQGGKKNWNLIGSTWEMSGCSRDSKAPSIEVTSVHVPPAADQQATGVIIQLELP